MRAALVVHQMAAELEASLSAMEQSVRQAAQAGAGLVLFPEAAPTGLSNNDDPEHDLPLGQPIPGPVTERLAEAARQRRVWLATGLLERDGHSLYDAAVLLRPDGSMAFRYRRIQTQWHGRGADPSVYRQGNRVEVAATPFGRVSCLLCGDLFDDAVVERVRAAEPDLLLFPFARNFGDGSFDQERWDRDEEREYVARAAMARCTVLMVNMLGDPALTPWPSFGGALVVGADGHVAARWPLGEPGILFADIG